MLRTALLAIIGALIALFLYVFIVMLGTKALGFQNITVIELGLSIIVSFICYQKLKGNETAKILSLGALYGSIVYLVLIFLGKTILFSVIGGITN